MSEKEFIWTDQKVKEFLHFRFMRTPTKVIEPYDISIEEFKSQHMAKEKYPDGIISFGVTDKKVVGGNDIITRQSYTNLNYQDWCWMHLNSNNKYSIHSVRNSAGEVLTVGDKTNEGKIERFSIMTATIDNISESSSGKDGLFCWTDGFASWKNIDYIHPLKTETVQYSISGELISVTGSEAAQKALGEKINGNKPPNPSILTEDGYEFKVGEEYILLNSDLSGCFTFYLKDSHILDPSEKYFKKMDNAKKYISENVAIFSRKQISDALESKAGSNSIPIYKGIIDLKKLGL